MLGRARCIFGLRLDAGRAAPPAPTRSAAHTHEAPSAAAPPSARRSRRVGHTRDVTPRELRTIERSMAAAERVRGLRFDRQVPVLVQDAEAIAALRRRPDQGDELERSRTIAIRYRLSGTRRRWSPERTPRAAYWTGWWWCATRATCPPAWTCAGSGAAAGRAPGCGLGPGARRHAGAGGHAGRARPGRAQHTQRCPVW